MTSQSSLLDTLWQRAAGRWSDCVGYRILTKKADVWKRLYLQSKSSVLNLTSKILFTVNVKLL